MKTKSVLTRLFLPVHRVLTAGFLALTFVQLPAFATTFTNGTIISVGNTNYDGTDIVVSNCTVTVDGTHAFSSLLVAGGGVLTHSYSPNGVISNLLSVVDESQVLNGTYPVTLLNSNIVTASVLVTDSGSTIVYTNGVDYLLTSPDGIQTQLQRTTNSTIPDGANVLASYDVLLGVLPAGFNLSVAGNAEVAAGGAINASGRGYGGGAGPGAGHTAGSPADGSGAGYGGIGGMSSSNAMGGMTYGSFVQPTNLGSGGGASYVGMGGAGGGAIQITAGGTFIINGTISADGANGTNSRSGGGSGGSIWITAHLVSGSGTISAQGGAGEPAHGGGGGGGRIAIQSDVNTFAGSLAAYGGAGAMTGGAGTVYTELTGQNGLLVFDNAGHAGTNSVVAISSASIDVLIRGNASVIPSGAWTIGNLTIASNGLLVASSALFPLNLTAGGNVTIQAGGSLLADNAGYTAGAGIGHGYNYYGTGYPCGGGGHGGGGANGSLTSAGGGTTYGSQTSPTTYGSGGGTYPSYSAGGAGGGAIQLNVSGILQVDGRLSANGGNGSGSGGGGGAGGSLWLTTGTLIGSGSITANGGNGADSIGGGGGGGRIAIYPAANLFGGTISAYGGGGANWGGAGTVFLQPTGQNGQLILDNGGHVGTNTLVQSASSADLFLRNGAIGSASSPVNFVNLFMSSNAWLTAYPYSSSAPAYTVNFSFSGNATIPAGSGIFTDALGYPGGQGPGAGRSSSSQPTYPCSGAGHGGYGANSTGNYALGGTTYDSPTSPASYGSGGGNYYSYPGGSGGGAIRLTVTGTLQVDGTISANGGNGSIFGVGGGSGGSIWLTVGTLSGAGSIMANGGSGVDSIGGGGGGGIIYVSCNNNSFAGAAAACGGGGANWGGAGTVLIQPYGQNGQLVLDNGGHAGTDTPLQSVSSTDLTLRNGAIGLMSGSLTFGNLLVSSNAWLLMTNSNYTVTLSSATIQAGGGIIADASGYASGQGPGAGQYYYNNLSCSGAGHGGYGANSSSTNGPGNYVLGGNTYDSTITPSNPGSGGGGGNYMNTLGGAGGGLIRLNVSGILQADGRISANGGNGSGLGGGGGSGGSIWLTVGTLSGTGSIMANGGNGANAIGGAIGGGGGGGGRIAIYPAADLFGGTISAYGGGGAGWGGAGTVYLKTNSQNYGQLILDNGGNTGTNTTFSASSIDLLVTGWAIGQGPVGGWSVRNLHICTNSVLTTVASTSSQTVTVTGNATIDAGGAISVDGTGSGASSGPGAGVTSSSSIGGGGHGGFGAANPAGYGGAYDSIQSPFTAGSGGGNGSGSSTAPNGGAGGGALRLNVTGTLAVNGRVSANGNNGDINSGGGSGGSLWIAAGTLAGSGTISANGGSGNGLGGGGGGGRISLGYTTSAFNGPISACGGGGYAGGGAGTIYTGANKSVGQLLVDNGGLPGTNTPLSIAYGMPSLPFNLTVGGGAVVYPQSTFPMLSNLTITAGGLLTSLSGQSNLDLVVLANVDIAAGGAIVVDANGFAQAGGPGAGKSVSGSGSGAGYGGLGGASATAAPGGTNYGSAQYPVDQGSGGGFGSGPLYGGSQGGGAIRLNVGGVFTLDGLLSANGNWGIQDNSGGGSGGSVWVTAGTLAGNGQITADGGEGELYGGGGGAGGRIALYSRANVFAGPVSVFGGEGDFQGADGSIFYSTNLTLQVISYTPAGIVSSGVSSVSLVFNEAPDPASFSGTDVSLTTPNGPLSADSFTVSMLNSSSYSVSFPLQTAVGNYTFTVGTNINDLYGQPMSQVCTGAFTISLPVIQGTITGTNGQPVPGVLIQPDGGLSTTTTDTNGNYALGILPGWSGTVVPSGGGFVFVPGSQVYTNVTASISNQNYVAFITIAPAVSTGLQADNLMMNWYGISGVTYQLYSSTNLVDWLPYGNAFPGTNGPVALLVPTGGDPARFFRVQAGN
jgi:hypothetical protein